MANVKITQGSPFDGDAVLQGGIGDYIYLINWDDINQAQTLTYDGTTNEIDALVLASGTQGYKFECPKGIAQIIPTTEPKENARAAAHASVIEVLIPEATQLQRDNLNKLHYNKVAAIIPLINGRKELYGLNVGLRIEMRILHDADNSGGIRFTLMQREGDPGEIKPPHLIDSAFDITSLDTPAA